MIGLVDCDVLIYWAAVKSEDPADAEEFFRSLFEETTEGSWADEFRVAMKGKNNYRKKLYPHYKGNRAPLEEDMKAKLRAAGNVAIKEYGAVPAHGMEADDLVVIWAEELRTAGEDWIIIGEDKDLKTIPGKFYNPKKNIIEHVSEDEADMFYHQQLLAGDPTDGIIGLKGVGYKTAAKLIGDAPLGSRMERVIEVWQEKRPDDWYEGLMETGTLVHILRSHEDFFYVPGITGMANAKEEEKELEPEV